MSGGVPDRALLWAHLLVVIGVSATYELLFLRHGMVLLDEWWALYAARQLEAGRALYRDVFFVFPPFHLVGAWLGSQLAPPGVVTARAVYAALTVGLCATTYLLGRRLMPPTFALLGALLLAVASPMSHVQHLLFGYRYSIFAVLALLAFGRRLANGGARWTVLAGICIGLSLCFRWTPGVAVGCGLALAIAAAAPSGRERLLEWARLGVGVAIPTLPVYGVLAAQVGLDTLWQELVVRPVAMTRAQDLPLPALSADLAFDRRSITRSFHALQFHAFPLLYLGYLIALAASWVRSRRERRPWRQALLLAVAVWGAVYFSRATGRADESHLASTLPPACVLLAHALYSSLRFVSRRTGGRVRLDAGWRPVTVCGAALAAWVWLGSVDLYLRPGARGTVALRSLPEPVYVWRRHWALDVDALALTIRARTRPGDRILDMSGSPVFHVLSDRLGPGGFDVVMPGTFLDAEEETRFLERIRRDPPAAVVWPLRPFDGRPERAVQRAAPRISRWVQEHYEPSARRGHFVLLEPR